MTDLMVDIETLSTRGNAYILSVGACPFDERRAGEPYVWRIEWAEQPGAHIDPNTIRWWLEQGLEPGSDLLSLRDVLLELRRIITPEMRIWARSPAFDLTILGHAYEQADLPIPWSWWLQRDVRTLCDGEADLPDHGALRLVKHDPVHDCLVQVAQVLEVRRRRRRQEKT